MNIPKDDSTCMHGYDFSARRSSADTVKLLSTQTTRPTRPPALPPDPHGRPRRKLGSAPTVMQPRPRNRNHGNDAAPPYQQKRREASTTEERQSFPQRQLMDSVSVSVSMSVSVSVSVSLSVSVTISVSGSITASISCTRMALTPSRSHTASSALS